MLVIGFSFAACGGGDDGGGNSNDGLTDDIHKIVPSDILDAFKGLGIEINGGKNPPNIEGTYLSSPHVLVRSNFSDNIQPGRQFPNRQITFSKQDNVNLTVVYDYISIGGIETGSGLGSYITGNGNKFSVFTETSGTIGGQQYKTVQLISGEITPSGIRNYNYAGIVTEEAPLSLKRGQGRLFYDSDGLAERQ